MSEKKYTLLPTTVEAAEAADMHSPDAPTHDATLHRRKLRMGFFKLCLIGLAFYLLFWMPLEDEDDMEREPHHRQGRHHRHPKGSNKFSFESHMQGDVDQLIAGSLESSIVWDRLAEMTDTFGHRLVGTEALEKSIDWVLERAKADGLSVTTEEVVVDYWQRNEESLYFLSPTRGPVKLHILGLGFSAPTPDPVNGLEAEIIVVHSKEELEQLGSEGKVKGKVVLLNKPFEAYGIDYIFRTKGAQWAEEQGAVAALVRSVSSFGLQTPHTGVSNAAKIPTAAISAEDADFLARSLKRHQQNPDQFSEWPKVKLTMGAETQLQSRTSRNIIMELPGRETPEEVVVVGGHIDSWDVGSGAVDDGAGCFIAWETLRQLSKLEQPPRRTVRAVFWTSEENGSPGGRVYAKNHPETNTTRHVFALESDNGVFDPFGIQFTAGSRAGEAGQSFSSAEYMTAAGRYFLGSRKDLGYPGAGHFVLPNGSGADIAPLCKQGVACAQFTPADPFPLPYSTSPYALKGQEESLKNEPHRKHAHKGRKHHKHHHHKHHGHGRHGELEQHRRPIDSGYFYYHHTEADSMSAFTPEQAKNSAAVMAFWAYIAAESRVEL